MTDFVRPFAAEPDDELNGDIDLISLARPALTHWKGVLLGALLGSVVLYGASYLVTPQFAATTSFLPPDKQQSQASSALASLSALSGLGNATKTSTDEYIGLMQSVTASDRIIRKFNLKTQWDVRYMADARKRLAKQVKIAADKKTGMISVEVTEADPVQAAAIANQYVEELRTMTGSLAVTEAQQRRVFFEHLLEQTRDKLAAAQTALEASGYTAGALNAEPRNAAESYARIKADLTTAQVRLQVLRGSLAEGSPELQSQVQRVDALSMQLAKIESKDEPASKSSDYVNRYREFKYQETLFDLFARQYETARVDESRDGGLIQVVDPASPPERKSSPSRILFALVGAVLGFAGAWIRFGLRERRARLDAATNGSMSTRV